MKLKEFLNHNRYTVVAQVVVCFVLIWIFSCQTTVPSISNPAMNVSRSELQAELDYYLAQANIKFAQLDKQDAFKQALFENAALWAATGTINPLGIFLSLGTIAGLGATTDNIRRRITEKKKPPP